MVFLHMLLDIHKNNIKPPSLYYIKNDDNIIISSEPLDKNNNL